MNISSLKKSPNLKIILLCLLSCTVIYYCIEIGNKNPFLNGPIYTWINILTLFCIESVLYAVFRRHWFSTLLLTLLSGLLSVANYYTLLFRNQPISTQDIHNAKTAMNVLGSYKLGFDVYIAVILLLVLIGVGVSLTLFKAEKERRQSIKRAAVESVALVGFSVVFMFVAYFSPKPIKPKNTFVWSWEESYYKYGYIASSIEVLEGSLNPVSMPEGYSEDTLGSAMKGYLSPEEENGETPDVIFILNETFYDIRDAADIETDAAIMPFIDGGKNMIRGRAVVAGTGGGTNKSEYELLTSNSLWLMPGITPFNFLDLSDAKSIVSHLKALGYSTWAGHPASSLNYSRGKAYPQLGFENVAFDKDFRFDELYGKRWYITDSSAYKTLTEAYEKMGSGPRFMYLLTIQNHGGWELNPPEEDIVHSKTDFGEYTDDVDEFLSCIRKSDNAFQSLTEYFEHSERKTVICMVGDHCPAFLPNITKEQGIEGTLKLRSTPYVIWANFPIGEDNGKNEENGETVSMPFIAPKALEAAGVSLSPFYSFMLKLEKEVPVITAFNTFITANGEVHQYSETTKFKKDIDLYFNLVYNSTGKKAKRINALFEPKN